MATEATKQIFRLIDGAKNMKRDLEQRIRSMESRKQRDKDRLHAEEALAASERQNNTSSGMRLRSIIDKQKQIWDEEHTLAEMNRTKADVDKKIGEIIHWTSQSEYSDERQRQEAVENAKQKFREIKI